MKKKTQHTRYYDTSNNIFLSNSTANHIFKNFESLSFLNPFKL